MIALLVASVLMPGTWTAERVTHYVSDTGIDEAHVERIDYELTHDEEKGLTTLTAGKVLLRTVLGSDVVPGGEGVPRRRSAGGKIGSWPVITEWNTAADLATDTVIAWAVKGGGTLQGTELTGQIDPNTGVILRSKAGWSLTGNYRISRRTGRVVRIDLEGTHFPLPGSTEVAHVRIRYRVLGSDGGRNSSG